MSTRYLCLEHKYEIIMFHHFFFFFFFFFFAFMAIKMIYCIGVPFLDLNLCISNGTVSTKIYDKRDDFDFDLVNFPFLDGDVPRRTSYGVYISQLIRFARASQI